MCWKCVEDRDASVIPDVGREVRLAYSKVLLEVRGLNRPYLAVAGCFVDVALAGATGAYVVLAHVSTNRP